MVVKNENVQYQKLNNYVMWSSILTILKEGTKHLQITVPKLHMQ